LKIISWNINGFRAITGQNPSRRFDSVTKENKLFSYIYSVNPDIICVQETKADPIQIDEHLRSPEGYESWYGVCRSKKGYSGTAIFSRLKPKEVHFGIGIGRYDVEGRIIQADFDDFLLFNVYFPNGTSGRDRVDYKLEFYDALFEYIEDYRKQGRKILICGDYNTAHKEIDLARPKENVETSGFLAEEREKIDNIISLGYVDTFREFDSEPAKYTWWSQRAAARERNIGWRIDYHFVTENFMDNVKNSYHHPDVMGSDHCPIILELDL
jgi:exodeoxyribonuclease-3